MNVCAMPVGQDVMPTKRLPAATAGAAAAGAAAAGFTSGGATSSAGSGGRSANADPITSLVLRIASLVDVSKIGLPAKRAGSIRMSVAKITTSAPSISSSVNTPFFPAEP